MYLREESERTNAFDFMARSSSGFNKLPARILVFMSWSVNLTLETSVWVIFELKTSANSML